MTAQELRDVIESALDDDDFLTTWRRKSFQALFRLVDDVERLKKEAGWILEDCQQRGDGAFRRCRKYIEKLRDYTYSGKGK